MEIDVGRRRAIVKAAAARRHAESDDLLTADVGLRIREARQARGLSLSQLGGEDLSRSFLSLVENGRSRVSLRALAIIADRLDLPMSHFLSGGEDSPDLAAALLLHEAEIAFGEQRSEDALRLLNEAEETARTALGNPARLLRARLLVDQDRIAEALSVLREGIGDLDSEK